MRIVLWTKQAQADLAAIRAFISQDSLHYASVIIFRIIAAQIVWLHSLNLAGQFQNSKIRWFGKLFTHRNVSSTDWWASTRFTC